MLGGTFHAGELHGAEHERGERRVGVELDGEGRVGEGSEIHGAAGLYRQLR